MTKHTPGPWQTNKTASHVFVNNGADHDGVICKMPFEPSPVQWASGPADLETTANARLIAAAPEMLNALKTAADFWQDSYPLPGSQPWLDTIRAVIAKATA